MQSEVRFWERDRLSHIARLLEIQSVEIWIPADRTTFFGMTMDDLDDLDFPIRSKHSDMRT